MQRGRLWLSAAAVATAAAVVPGGSASPAAPRGTAGTLVFGAEQGGGEGGPRDLIEGYMWFSLAAAQGNAAGKEARDTLGGQLTPDELARAKKMALEWTPQPHR